MAMLAFSACHEKKPNTNAATTLEDYECFSDAKLDINLHRIWSNMDSLLRNDSDRLAPDLHTRAFYSARQGFLWITRKGVSLQADTMVGYLRKMSEMGFSLRTIRLEQIEQDLAYLRYPFDADSLSHRPDINLVMARLEYRLTKAYARYVVGQRFGFTNPSYILNRIDTMRSAKHDTIVRPTRYRDLFDIPMERPDKHFYALMFRMAGSDSLPIFLREVQPQSPFYHHLEGLLSKGNLSGRMRAKIMCNMERCRWRTYDYPQRHKKYVLVNLPSFHLMAVDGADTLNMRIGCGSFETKTPLLFSHIKRMDVNPQWVIPRSIIDKDIVRHAGNSSYFKSRNFFVADRTTGEEVPLGSVTRQMLDSRQYSVVQRGGKGNSLGRIIFRFDNNFSVFLHDTSNRGVFGREDRGVSHGCVRVEKPFDLAVFLLAEKDEQLIDRIKYSMTADSLAEKARVVRSVKVEPAVPLYITYFTLYPMAGGRMEEYSDVYGYDAAIYQSLKKYM